MAEGSAAHSAGLALLGVAVLWPCLVHTAGKWVSPRRSTRVGLVPNITWAHAWLHPPKGLFGACALQEGFWYTA